MTFRWTWDLCDVSHGLAGGALASQQRKRLVRLYKLLNEDVNSDGNGVSSSLLTGFKAVGQEVLLCDAANKNLVSAFYYLGTVVRSQLHGYCEKQGLDYRKLLTGPQGDASFSHKSLAYKD